MIKYTSIALLATMISFSNEIGNLCAALGGIDVVDVMRGVHLSKYITLTLPGGERMAPGMQAFLAAGCGFGGSCLPKDVKALVHTAETAGEPAELMRAAEHVNARQRRILFEKMKQFFGGALAGKRIALWGLAFKANTDDMREAPSLALIEALTGAGARVVAYDPVALDNARRI